MINWEKDFCDLLDIRAQYSISTSAETLVMLRNSVKNNLYYIFKNEFSRPIGYLAWARINKESFLELSRSTKMPVYEYEWDEGNIIVLTDVLHKSQSAFQLRGELVKIFHRARIVVLANYSHLSIYLLKRNRYTLKNRIQRL